MNLLWIFVFVLAAGIVMILAAPKRQPEDKDPPMLTQWGYIGVLVGGFGILAQYMSFSAVLLSFVVVTGIVAGIDRFWLRRQRAAAGKLEPALVEYSRGFFPIILVVFLLRSFLAEPFQIPSSSMRPGLVVGDFILVNKFAYGIRTPIVNNVLVPVGQVERGDVVVFNFPPNPQVNFIKRIVGLPGDAVEYRNKQLIVNGKPVQDKQTGTYDYVENQIGYLKSDLYRENNGSKQYDVLRTEPTPTLHLSQVAQFPGRENCSFDPDGFVCKVPEGQYFAMGDNRDNSHDSRYWGFVPDNMLVGKAFMVWMNFGDFGRIGHRIQ